MSNLQTTTPAGPAVHPQHWIDPKNSPASRGRHQAAPQAARAVVQRGYNHNVELDGTLYHVQTETEGRSVSTSVFVDGQVVASRRSPIHAGEDGQLASQIAAQQKSTLKDLVGRRLAIRPSRPQSRQLVHLFECLLWELRLQTFVDRLSLTRQLRTVREYLAVILGHDEAREWAGRADFEELSGCYTKIVQWLHLTHDDASRFEAVRLCQKVRWTSRRILGSKPTVV